MIDTIIDFLTYAISFIGIISIIVFIHEFGHFIVARWCGVKVEAFSIGFGKEIFGWNDRKGTRWKISLIPAGGYVKMFGDAGAASTADNNALEEMSEEEKKLSFHYKPLWRKSAIVAAGPIANFILTITIFTYFIYTSGIASTEPVVGEIIPDTPAAASGLMADDRILTVDGDAVSTFGEIPNKILVNVGDPVALKIQRGEEIFTLDITPRITEETDGFGNTIKRPLLGFRSQQMTFEDISFPLAIVEASKRTYDMVDMSLTALWQMVSGKRSADDLSGPIRIAKLSGDVATSGETVEQTVHRILWFIALISVNLGFVNLLPIPLLDGGHLAYYAIEASRGKPMADKAQEIGYKIGFAIIMSLMAFTIFNDLRQLIW